MSRKSTSKKTRHKPKAVLRLPDLDRAALAERDKAFVGL